MRVVRVRAEFALIRIVVGHPLPCYRLGIRQVCGQEPDFEIVAEAATGGQVVEAMISDLQTVNPVLLSDPYSAAASASCIGLPSPVGGALLVVMSMRMAVMMVVIAMLVMVMTVIMVMVAMIMR